MHNTNIYIALLKQCIFRVCIVIIVHTYLWGDIIVLSFTDYIYIKSPICEPTHTIKFLCLWLSIYPKASSYAHHNCYLSLKWVDIVYNMFCSIFAAKMLTHNTLYIGDILRQNYYQDIWNAWVNNGVITSELK